MKRSFQGLMVPPVLDLETTLQRNPPGGVGFFLVFGL